VKLRLAAIAALGVLLGLGAFTLQYARGLSYLSDDPGACLNCHVMRDVHDGWQKGPHHAAAVCNDCHTPAALVQKYLVKAENGWHHSKAFTLGNFHEPIRIRARNARVLEANCRRCHLGLVSELAGHAASDADGIACVRCHAGAGHGPTASSL